MVNQLIKIYQSISFISELRRFTLNFVGMWRVEHVEWASCKTFFLPKTFDPNSTEAIAAMELKRHQYLIILRKICCYNEQRNLLYVVLDQPWPGD